MRPPQTRNACAMCQLCEGSEVALAGLLAPHGIACGHAGDLAAWLTGPVVLECVGDRTVMLAGDATARTRTDAPAVRADRPDRNDALELVDATYAVTSLAGLTWVAFRADADLDAVAGAVLDAVSAGS